MAYVVHCRSVSLGIFYVLFCLALFLGCSTKWYQNFTMTLQSTKSQSCIDITHKTQDTLAQKMCLSIPFESMFVENDVLKVYTSFSRDEDDRNFYTSIFLAFKVFENIFYLYEYGEEQGYDNSRVRRVNVTTYYYRYDEQEQHIPLTSLNDEILESLEKCWNLYKRQCYLDDEMLESLKQ